TNDSVNNVESTNHQKKSDFGADQLPNRHRRWHIVDKLQAKAQPEEQLGDSSSRAKSLGGLIVAIPTISLINPPS
ncbi:MAG: hypothetical protein SOX83_08205, partial [Sodaliphilus sp.]|nr:hypothetical protein [Sodaliphilus sp.]